VGGHEVERFIARKRDTLDHKKGGGGQVNQKGGQKKKAKLAAKREREETRFETMKERKFFFTETEQFGKLEDADGEENKNSQKPKPELQIGSCRIKTQEKRSEKEQA